MRTIAVAVLVILASAPGGLAQTRVDTTRMSCAQIRSVLDQNGRAILGRRSARTGTIVATGVFVRDGRSCSVGQTAQPAIVVAADTNNCRVQQCQTNSRGGR